MSERFTFYQPRRRSRLRLKGYAQRAGRFIAQHRVRLGIILAVGVLAGVAVWAWGTYGAPKPKAERKIVYQVENDNPTEDALYGIPKDAVSDVCKRVASEKVSSAIGETVRPGRVSIQNATTKEGSVSGCYFQAESPKNVKAVNVTSRIFASEQAAVDAFKKLSKLEGKRFTQGKADIIYAQSSRQLVLQKSTQLSTIILTQAADDSALTQDMFTKLADLL